MEIRSLQALVCQNSIDGQRRTLSAMASASTLDRTGEMIEPTAFAESLESYRANPVIMAGHTYGGLSGEPTVIGRALSIEITPEGLPFQMQFAETPLAEQYWQLYRGGFMRAFSVGFLPRKSQTRPVDGRAVRVHTEVELLEISAVAVPANRQALVRARRGPRSAMAQSAKELAELLAAVVDERLEALGLPAADRAEAEVRRIVERMAKEI